MAGAAAARGQVRDFSGTAPLPSCLAGWSRLAARLGEGSRRRGGGLVPTSLAHATDLASDVESMAEREEINKFRMIAAIKMEAKI